MITEDHVHDGRAIARELGIEGRAITGATFAAISDEELLAQRDIGVVGPVAPEDKIRLVQMLKRMGNVVSMTGTGSTTHRLSRLLTSRSPSASPGPRSPRRPR